MGEIGGNEFNLAFIQGISTEVIGGLVPEVIKAISAAIGVTFLSSFAKVFS